MTYERIGPHGRPCNWPATSREINQAIELLREAKADPQAVRLLEIWNAHRLVEAAQRVETNEELRNLFAGLKPTSRGFLAGASLDRATEMEEGAWS
jgi:hypothetical protein